MSTSKDHLDHIREQFTRQSEAYKKLDYVRDEAGLDKVVKLARISENDTVLDVACGPGFLTMAFARQCKSATGVDATDAFLDSARALAAERGVGNIVFVQGNVESLQLNDDQFDRVICRAAFHHFPEPAKVLSEMKRVCKPDGNVLILDMVASEDPVKAARHNELEQLCDPTHVRALSKTEFTDLFKECNLHNEFEREGTTSYTLDDWIGHGGPSPENEAAIRKIVGEAVDTDAIGIPLVRENGAIQLTHVGIAYVLKK